MDVNLITSHIAGTHPTHPAPKETPARPKTAVERPDPEPPPERHTPGVGVDLKFTLRSADAEARFDYHEATNQVMVTITDRVTGEVIREIPSRERLDLIAALQGKGNILDTAQ